MAQDLEPSQEPDHSPDPEIISKSKRRSFLKKVDEEYIERKKRQKLRSVSSEEIEKEDKFFNNLYRARAERSKEMASKDKLTGLPNRRAFDEAIARLTSEKKPLAMLILDIDKFKNVNDTYGHDAGDEVLKKVSQRLEQSIKSHEDILTRTRSVGRIGGEEFAVLLPGITNVDDLTKVAERIRLNIGDSPMSVDIGGKTIELPITVSIGGGLYRGESIKSFFRSVDQKLFLAKKNGRNQSVVVQPDAMTSDQAA